MKTFVSTVAALALAASVGSAQEAPVTTPPATGTPVVGATAVPVVEATTTTAAPQRRGLFSRLRDRGTSTATMPVTGTTVVTPGTVTTTPGAVITPAPTTAPAPMPMPMPGTKTTPSTMTTTPSGITLGNFVATADPVVMQASATETAAPRRGLFGRLRNR